MNAVDETDLTLVTGALEVSNTVGIGASLGVSLVTKDTRAFIDGGSVVDGKGNGGGGFQAFDGSVPPEDPLPTHAIFGVVVQAFSREGITNVAIAGTGDAAFAIVGAAAVNVIDSDTTAFIADAQINHLAGASAAQDVVVAAAKPGRPVLGRRRGRHQDHRRARRARPTSASSATTRARSSPAARTSRRTTTSTCWRSRASPCSRSRSASTARPSASRARSRCTRSAASSTARAARSCARSTPTTGRSPGFPDLGSFADTTLADLSAALADALKSDHSTPGAGASFNGATAVDGDADTIDLGAGHGFLAGDAAVYTLDGRTRRSAASRTAARTSSAAIAHDPNKVTLHGTASDAINGTNPIDLTPQTTARPTR